MDPGSSTGRDPEHAALVPSGSRGIYRVGDLIVDVGQARVTRGDEVIPLPRLSFDMLVALIRAAPNLLSQDELIAQIWPGLVVSPETVTQRTKLLRAALDDDPKLPRYVAVVRGRGCKLVAEVTELTPVSTVIPAPPQSWRPHPSPVEVSTSATRTRRWALLSAVLVTLALATTISVWNAKAPGPHGNGVREAVRPPVRSVAVLPFENLSGESSSRVLSLGIAESVMHQLATQSQLMVIARSSSFAFEGRHADARDIGRQLNARYLLEGSVQAERGRLRVMTDLIDSETGADVWSMRFDRTPTDVFAMQDEIATAVARALELSVKAGAAFTPNTAQTQNMDAWMAYQQGRALAATRKLADLDLAGERFAEAARLDPQFALAYVARADTLAVRRMYSQSDSWLGMQPAFTSDAEKAEALEWLTHAIAVNPNEGTAYSVRAWLSDDPQKAEADYRRGLALNPNDAVGYERFAKLLYSFRTPDKMYVEPAKRDEAYEVVDHAIELDPLSPSPYITKALMLLYGRGNATEAESLLRRALELQPNYYPAVMRLAEARYFQGEIADAIHYAEQGLALEPSAVWARHYLLRMYLDLNDVEAATELADEGLARDTLLRVPIALFQHDWSKADHLAAADSDLGTPLDIEFCVWAWLQRVRLTHDYEPVRKRLAEWSGVRWDAQGVPSIPETNLDYADAMGLAEVLRWMGDNKRSDQLLHAIVRVLDHGSHDLKRGEQLFGPTRPEVLALLGDREGALTTLRNLSGGIGEGAWWYILDLEPAFDGLRDDPRFRSLRAQLNERAIQQRRRLDRMREDGSVRSRGKADRQGAQ